MEQRLFCIGIVMFLFAIATRKGTEAKKIDNAKRAAAWHALFCFLAGLSAMVVLTVSWMNRGNEPSVTAFWNPKTLATSLGVALVAAAWGYRSGLKNAKTAKGRDALLAEDLEWADTVFSAVILAAFMMYFLIQAFKIPSGSMRSTLLEGDHLFVNKILYGIKIPFADKRLLRFRSIGHKDVVVFRFPSEDPQSEHCGSSQYGKDFIKRVVGVPGDTIEIRDGIVFRNGEPVQDETYAQYLDVARIPRRVTGLEDGQYQEIWSAGQLDANLGEMIRDHLGPVKVGPGEYFVMGDNRDRSCDSRFWGPVPEANIKGKAWFIYWPPKRIAAIY